jgi:alpha-tubulin suppressor-like RCC1 family protein
MSGFYDNLILMTENGEIYDLKLYDYAENIKDFELELKIFKNNESENEKIVMISCGYEHSLALSENGRVFGWGNNCKQLGVDVEYSSEPIIIELNDLKIKKLWGYS